jgi:hypothetical protein
MRGAWYGRDMVWEGPGIDTCRPCLGGKSVCFRVGRFVAECKHLVDSQFMMLEILTVFVFLCEAQAS